MNFTVRNNLTQTQHLTLKGGVMLTLLPRGTQQIPADSVSPDLEIKASRGTITISKIAAPAPPVEEATS